MPEDHTLEITVGLTMLANVVTALDAVTTASIRKSLNGSGDLVKQFTYRLKEVQRGRFTFCAYSANVEYLDMVSQAFQECPDITVTPGTEETVRFLTGRGKK